ncbi:baseplate assembly protein [Salinisphaera orenii]|uniref:baseplate assembly protein n=1 Tax=Salinisphaera orenii TaxID=856731 RepID=UPI000DBE2C51
MPNVDLSQLPAPEIVEALDYEAIRAAMVADLQSRAPELEQLTEADPAIKVLEVAAYRELALRQRVNEAAKAVMLAYSTGTDLDQLAANYNVERLVTDPGDPDATPPVPPTYEFDADLRTRVQSAFEGLSVAGPRAAYVYHALSADGRVADATATSPEPAEAVVSILARDGDGSASQDLLATVDDALSAEDVRPVADLLVVQSAQITNYQITATLYVYPGPEQGPILAASRASAKAYVAEQRRLGRDIRLSAVYAALTVAGVQRVELTAPTADVVLDDTQAAYCTDISISIGGTDE